MKKIFLFLLFATSCFSQFGHSGGANSADATLAADSTILGTRYAISKAIMDSLARYTTNFKLDTTNVDTSQLGKFVRDHQSTSGGGLTSVAYSNLVQALKDSLASYATHAKRTSGNPHSVSKSDVGLSNVENTALSSWAGSTNLQTFKSGAVDSGEVAPGAITSYRISDGEIRYVDLATALKDSMKAYASHAKRTDNPHSVDKTDIGLANVENTAISTWAGSANLTTLKSAAVDSGEVGIGAITSYRIKDADVRYVDISQALKDSLAASATHAKKTNNPHSVTKTQIGLSAVENTALSTWAGSVNLETLKSSAIDSGEVKNEAITSTKIKNGEVKYWDLAQAVKDSLLAKMLPAQVSKFISDSLARYTTNFKIDTTAIDAAMFEKFIRDHQSVAAGDGVGVLPAALSDSLNKYRTDFKLDTTNVHSAQWEAFIQDHQIEGSDGDITSVVAGSGLTGGAIAGAATIDLNLSANGGLQIINSDSLSMKLDGSTLTKSSVGLKVTPNTFAAYSHTHTGADLSSIDISDDTNLSGGIGLKMNGDAVDILLSLRAGLEISTDSLGVKLDGVTLTKSSAGLKVTPNTYADYSHTHAYISTSLASAYLLVGNGSGVAAAVAMSGDATISNTGAVTVSDDSHNHTTTTVSGLDISSDTNLSAGSGIVLTGDALSHSTDNGYKHIPSTGASAQILQYSSAGTAKWVSMSGDATIADGGAITLSANAADSTNLANESVTSETIKDGQVKTEDFSPTAQAPAIGSSNNPTTDAAGEIAIDANNSFVEFYDGTASRHLGALQSRTFVIIEPDIARTKTDDIILMHVMADAYPFGITIKDIAISGSASFSDTHVIEEWNDRAGSTQSTVESITVSAANYQEDDGTLSDSSIAADAFLNINLDDSTDDIASLEITITFWINGGN